MSTANSNSATTGAAQCKSVTASQVLVAGGGGYIGSHTVVSLIEAGFTPVILDNWCNANRIVLERIEAITGTKPLDYAVDLRDEQALAEVFAKNNITAVIHFAGLKAVGESTQLPFEYYDNNVGGTLSLLKAMRNADCHQLVFSSSATVYGDPESVPIPEQARLSATNPYGRTKLMIEDILRDLAQGDPRWQIAILRYFNPVGAHRSGLIGEDPHGIPNNLVPYIAQVAVGQREQLNVFGNDYATPDGTGMRDYVHVVDLAEAHLSALQVLHAEHGCEAYNVGTGKPYSVLEIVKAFELASGQRIPYEIQARRTGDIATCYADVSYSRRALKWQARLDLAAMLQDHWNWQRQNPQGY